MLRREDQERLGKPYEDDAETQVDVRFERALGVASPEVEALLKAIREDLDAKAYGIGWWSAQLKTRRRILISDHLHQCVASIQTNLVEAKLHLMSALGCWEQEAAFLAGMVTIGANGAPVTKHPEWKAPADHLPHRLAAMHVAGVFRAIGSVLDCLGAGFIGVLALPTSLVRADVDVVRRWARDAKRPARSPGVQLQLDACDAFERLVLETGPSAWLAWAIDYRNMLVHRARRFSQNRLQASVFQLDRKSAPTVVTTPVHHLTLDPGRSDIEGFVSSASMPVLTEDARATLDGLVSSTHQLVARASSLLLGYWQKRRAEPTLLAQPKEQWRDSPTIPDFPGYEPGSMPLKFTQLVLADSDLQRMLAAALLNGDHKKWETFDD